MGVKKEKKKPLGRGVEALLGSIDKKVDERKQIPYAPKGFAEDQETLALSRHELLLERNKLKDRAGKAEAAIRNLHKQIDELKAKIPSKIPTLDQLHERDEVTKPFEYIPPTAKQMAEETLIRAGSSPKTVTIEQPQIKPLIPSPEIFKRPEPTPEPTMGMPRYGERTTVKEIPIVKTVEVPSRFDWTFEFALAFLLAGGILIGIALAQINLTRGTYATMLQMQTTENGYPEERPRDYIAPSVLSSQADTTSVQGGAK